MEKKKRQIEWKIFFRCVNQYLVWGKGRQVMGGRKGRDFCVRVCVCACACVFVCVCVCVCVGSLACFCVGLLAHLKIRPPHSGRVVKRDRKLAGRNVLLVYGWMEGRMGE